MLADGVQGGTGLWSFGASGQWAVLGATPNATALGRTSDGIAVASGHEVDFRPTSDLSHAGSHTTLKWSAGTSTAPVVSLTGSPAGKLAVATADERSLNYWLAAADGTVTAMASAPTQSFTPLVAWLDESRVVVLSTDNQQVSRLAVVNLATHGLNTINAVLGVTVFGASTDGQSVAVATEKGVYAGPVAAFLGGTQPQQIATLADAQVVWALSTDTAGAQVYVLAGTEAADGTVSALHELVYTKQGSAWIRVLDSPAPFTKAIAQVCLS